MINVCVCLFFGWKFCKVWFSLLSQIQYIYLMLRILLSQIAIKSIKSNDNNWIHCYRCSFQYCFLCGEPCFGLYHFNDEYGCKKSSLLKDDLKLKTKVRSVTKSWYKCLLYSSLISCMHMMLNLILFCSYIFSKLCDRYKAESYFNSTISNLQT